MSDFQLSNKNLVTLKGFEIPEVINGNFYCHNNNLTSLEFSPKAVSNIFSCDFNKLTSLEFGPKEVGVDYYCGSNQLTSLEFCATKIRGGLNADNNYLITNLKDIHRQFKNGYIGDHLNLQDTPVKSHLLGIILIPKLREILIDNDHLQKILNKHIQGNRDVLECQEELIQNGFKEFARL